MRFTLTIDCDNDAFQDTPHPEVARLLRKLSERVSGGSSMGKLLDANGNTVGRFGFDDGEAR